LQPRFRRPLAGVLDPTDFEKLRLRLNDLPEPPNSARLQKGEWLGALAVFFWVFVTTFPVTLPFMFVDQLHRAMRLSNLIAVVMLFITGFAYGRCIRRSPCSLAFHGRIGNRAGRPDHRARRMIMRWFVSHYLSPGASAHSRANERSFDKPRA
jgi:hypothetical protein